MKKKQCFLLWGQHNSFFRNSHSYLICCLHANAWQGPDLILLASRFLTRRCLDPRDLTRTELSLSVPAGTPQDIPPHPKTQPCPQQCTVQLDDVQMWSVSWNKPHLSQDAPPGHLRQHNQQWASALTTCRSPEHAGLQLLTGSFANQSSSQLRHKFRMLCMQHWAV